MENPTFHLEGVVRTKAEDLEDFEGPLTLILQLLSKNKIEIQDIQISVILDQYLAYLDEMKAMDLEVASEFVAMVSHLVYIKTRTLLSGDREVTELEQLISSLEDLKRKDVCTRIRAVTPLLAEMYRRGVGYGVKPPEYIPVDRTYRYQHEKGDLYAAMRRILERGDSVAAAPVGRPFSMPARITYSITEKTRELLDRLKQYSVLGVSGLLYESRSRTELVATFVAILELCKSGLVYLAGTEENMTMSYITPAQSPETQEESHGDS